MGASAPRLSPCPVLHISGFCPHRPLIRFCDDYMSFIMISLKATNRPLTVGVIACGRTCHSGLVCDTSMRSLQCAFQCGALDLHFERVSKDWTVHLNSALSFKGSSKLRAPGLVCTIIYFLIIIVSCDARTIVLQDYFSLRHANDL